MNLDQIIGNVLKSFDHATQFGNDDRTNQILDFATAIEPHMAELDGLEKVHIEMLVEEMIIWWCLADRLKHTLGQEPMMASGTGSSPPRVHAALDALAKTRERMKKTMDELIEKLENESATEGKGLASLVQDLMKRTEDVFEDAVEPRKDQTNPQKKSGKPGQHRQGDSPAQSS